MPEGTISPLAHQGVKGTPSLKGVMKDKISIMKGDGASVPVLHALEVDFVLNQEDLDKYEGGERAGHSDK